MHLARLIMTVVIVAVAILGPTLFMATSPCLECDGVCGAAATFASVEIRAVVFVLPLTSESAAQIPPTPLLLSELPPRPLLSAV